ncbi:hypothetical protein [Kordiimonas aestuarii]|uniref:hypothetical protein n=1 Tax=Kordiimonas aestuarii TaxID=1005925 RepID=UPI0021CFC551|nr:hypothetical protein [Kordiimonas aestuarii]
MDLFSLNDVERHLDIIPSDVFNLKTMLAKGEQAILYRLARDFVKPGHAIIDAGAFLGGSTYAFAAGLRDRTDSGSFHGSVMSYDQFLADEPYLREYLQDHFPDSTIDVSKTFSFRHLYDRQVAPVKDYVTTIEGSLLAQSWDTAKPIDVLFVDVCKTLPLNQFVLEHFFPALIPGRSVLIQQDFHHIFHPYIHVTMELLKEYFETIVSGMAASRVYVLKKAIPPHVLQEVIDYAYDRETIVKALDDVVTGSAKMEKPLLRYLVPWMYHQWGDSGTAHQLAEEVTDHLHAGGYIIPPQAYIAFPKMKRVD